MPDPHQNAERRGWIESILRYIPGFSGYLEKSYRRESDELARKWLADQLDEGKRGIDKLVKNFTGQGRLADLNPCQNLLTEVDTVVGKLRTAPAGYSGFFDFVQVDETKLEKVYAVEMGLVETVKQAREKMEQLPDRTDEVNLAINQVSGLLESIRSSFADRSEILTGLSANK